jgi:hypothetical protein
MSILGAKKNKIQMYVSLAPASQDMAIAVTNILATTRLSIQPEQRPQAFGCMKPYSLFIYNLVGKAGARTCLYLKKTI